MTTDLWVERTLVCCEQVPSGRVAAYGDIGGIVGRVPRWVGNVLARSGREVPWWRITNAAGDPPVTLQGIAFEHWSAEGIEVRPNGRGCRIARFRADLDTVAAAYDKRMARVLADAGLALPTLSAPAMRALEGIGVRALEELAEHDRREVAGLHGMGPKALTALDTALADAGLDYRR